MTPTKDDIKAWLKSHRRDRHWLGEQLGVGRRAVDNWLSSNRDIPDTQLRLIARLMADDEAAARQSQQLALPTNQAFSLEVTHQQFRNYSAAALASQETLEQWCLTELDRAAATLRVADGD